MGSHTSESDFIIILDPHLFLTPCDSQSAFGSSLATFNFNIFPLLVVDLMHEFELGVWKSVLTHLLQILYSCGADTVAEFDHRYAFHRRSHPHRLQDIPTFGVDTIRKFANDVSAMRKLAARDFEDILQVSIQRSKPISNNRLTDHPQCIIPAIEGLLPKKHEKHILDLLFLLATWHAYAKLRLHTDHTLTSFERLTKPLGAALRHFGGKLSDSFDTKELPKEASA